MDLKVKTLLLSNGLGATNSLKNWLFYSDEVIWRELTAIVCEHVITTAMYNIAEEKGIYTEISSFSSMKEIIEFVLENKKDEPLIRSVISRYNSYCNLCKKIGSDGFSINIDTFDLVANILENTTGDKFPFKDNYTKRVFSIIIEDVENMSENVNYISFKSNALNTLGYKDEQVFWNPYKAVEEILNALRKTQILPDISFLPIAEIRILKDKLKDDLTLMHAEQLFLTEELRKMVGEDISKENIAREAANLITTRVIPVIKEASIHVNSEMKSKLRKYKTKAIKMVGLTGLGFINPKGFIDAMVEGISAIAEATTDDLGYKPATASANFAIKMEAELEELKK